MGLFSGIALWILMAPFGATLPSSGGLAFVFALVPRVFLLVGACFPTGTAVTLDVMSRLLLVARSTLKDKSRVGAQHNTISLSIRSLHA